MQAYPANTIHSCKAANSISPPPPLPKPAWATEISDKIDVLGEVMKLREILSQQITINRALLKENSKLKKKIDDLENQTWHRMPN
jgi:hypothetical protein